eukprot:GHRR01016654.1.p1 GENE.GHRR01016654.1~~GHRR01016654.1.p1  ORF type:complete len:602 (+),score=264.49 GHRR01016654.1:428-2233(+)
MPLHYAATGKSVEVLRFLIQHSTWLDMADAADDTALHLASRQGFLEGVKLLLASKAAIGIPNKRGLSPLGEAVAVGDIAIALTLINAGAEVQWRAAGYTLLHVAAGLSKSNTLDLLLKQPKGLELINDTSNSDGATPLHAAAMAGSARCVQLLLTHGADAGIAGTQGQQPWEVVQAATEELQQQLVQQLQQLAGTAVSSSNKHTSEAAASGTGKDKPQPAAAAKISAPAAAGGSVSPVAAYSIEFASLSASDQGRKVETLARMTDTELSQLGFLTDQARVAIRQVRRAHQLLSCYRAIAALRSDESFQEDASEPRVQEALREMGLSNSFDKYVDDRQVMSVAAKLKKFHAVTREAGGVRLGLQDVLVQPGQYLEQLMEQDQQQIDGLSRALAAARAEAVAAITGRPMQASQPVTSSQRHSTSGQASSSDQSSSSSGTTRSSTSNSTNADGGPAHTIGSQYKAARPGGHMPRQASITEIEVAEPVKPADGGSDLDQLLQQHDEQQAVQKKPLDLDSMTFGQRMRYELINSFKQAAKIMCMLFVMWGIMWAFGLMPWQQDAPVMEGRLQQALRAQQEAKQLQQDVLGQQRLSAAGGAAHQNEL